MTNLLFSSRPSTKDEIESLSKELKQFSANQEYLSVLLDYELYCVLVYSKSEVGIKIHNYKMFETELCRLVKDMDFCNLSKVFAYVLTNNFKIPLEKDFCGKEFRIKWESRYSDDHEKFTALLKDYSEYKDSRETYENELLINSDASLSLKKEDNEYIAVWHLDKYEEKKLTPEEKKVDLWVEDFEVLRPEEDTGKCCFCGSIFDGRGNSTWPIYYEQDGETYRCCDKCNEEYVVAARKDKTLIMKFREKFGISYERYEK